MNFKNLATLVLCGGIMSSSAKIGLHLGVYSSTNFNKIGKSVNFNINKVAEISKFIGLRDNNGIQIFQGNDDIVKNAESKGKAIFGNGFFFDASLLTKKDGSYTVGLYGTVSHQSGTIKQSGDIVRVKTKNTMPAMLLGPSFCWKISDKTRFTLIAGAQILKKKQIVNFDFSSMISSAVDVLNAFPVGDPLRDAQNRAIQGMQSASSSAEYSLKTKLMKSITPAIITKFSYDLVPGLAVEGMVGFVFGRKMTFKQSSDRNSYYVFGGRNATPQLRIGRTVTLGLGLSYKVI